MEIKKKKPRWAGCSLRGKGVPHQSPGKDRAHWWWDERQEKLKDLTGYRLGLVVYYIYDDTFTNTEQCFRGISEYRMCARHIHLISSQTVSVSFFWCMPVLAWRSIETFTMQLVQLTNLTSSDLNLMDFKGEKRSFRNNNAPL